MAISSEANIHSLLARDVLLSVFRLLSPRELARCAQVCQAWRVLAYDDSLWEPHLIAFLNPALQPDSAEAVRELSCVGVGKEAGPIVLRYQLLMSSLFLGPKHSLDMDLFRQRLRAFEYGDNENHMFHLLLTGMPGVGKTSFARRFFYNLFDSEIESTVSCRFFSDYDEGNRSYARRALRRPDNADPDNIVKRAWIQFRDMVWGDRNGSTGSQGWGYAYGVFVFYDVSDRGSWTALPQLLDYLSRVTSDSSFKMVVGCKADLVTHRAVPLSEVLTFCRAREMVYCEASAKTGQGVDGAVATMVELIRGGRFIRSTLTNESANAAQVRPERTQCGLM